MSFAVNRVFLITGLKRIMPASAFVLMLFFYAMAFQGSRGVWEPDEGRYTDVAVRMLNTGDYIVPYLNEDTPHLNKPPLAYWAIAEGIRLLGYNEWGVRLPYALAFMGTILLVYTMAKRLTPARPWLPAVIYATSLFPFVAGNIATTDTLLALWEILAVAGFICWRHGNEDKRGGRLFINVMWLGFGLSFLTKGPPGLLPLPAILVFVIIKDGRRSLPWLFPMTGVALFFVIGLGWYFVVISMNPDLAAYFLRDEVAGRIFSGMHHRNPEWYKGFTIYLPALILGMLPWTFYLLRQVVSVHRTLFSRIWWIRKFKEDQWTLFLVLWVLIPLTVFFLSKSRLPLYILPLFAPISIITGRLPVFGSGLKRRNAILLTIWVIILLGLKFAGAVFPHHKDSRPLANAISGAVTPLPSEVVFIDSDPVWGLSLYLDCQIKEISPLSDDEDSFKKFIGEEISKNGNRLVFVTKKDKETEVEGIFNDSGRPVRLLGEYGSWAFMEL